MSASIAQVSGDSGCYGCDAPELVRIGTALEESFSATDPEVLARQAWAGDICANHPCFNENMGIGEQAAKDLLQDFIVRKQRGEDRLFTMLGIGIAAISAVISLFALWQTHVASREARAASDRSIRNEARIEQLSEES